MNKYIPYAIIGTLVLLAVVFVSIRLNTKTSLTNTLQNEEIVTETISLPVSVTQPVSISQIVFNDKSAVNAVIDNELDQIDRELKEINDYNLDVNSLSDEQLGL